MTRLFSLLLGLLLAFGGTVPAHGQPLRAGETFYGKVGVGISEYTGEYSPSSVPYGLGHFGEGGFPYVVRGEFGYQVLPELAVGVGVETGQYPFTSQSERLEDTRRSAVQLLARYTHRPKTWRAAPYVDLGRVLTFGGVRGGHGLSVGLGVDVALTRRMSLNVEARSNTLWPDNATDGQGIGTEGVDHLSQLLGVGLKVNFSPAPVPPRVLLVAGSTRVTVGEEVTYTARVNEEATRPLQRRWTVGGRTDASTTLTHTFGQAGTYTIVFEAENEAGRARDSMQVEVVPPPQPAVVAELRAEPRPSRTGQPVQFRGQAEGDAPLSYRWDFGDGTTGTGSAPTHTYKSAGTYTVRLTARNEAGQDTERLSIPVKQATAPVAGTVTHAETGEPLLNARVVMASADTASSPSAIDTTALRTRLDTTGVGGESGAGGVFALGGVPTGPVVLIATKAGFKPVVKWMDHSAEDTTQVPLALTPGQETATSIERDLERDGRRVLENVHFAFDSATIEDGGEATLRAVRKVIQERMPEQHFIIEGHTDAQGSEAYNKQLSQRRASAVQEWLQENGVSPNRLAARGQGEAHPLSGNDTPAGRRENRRVEIVVRPSAAEGASAKVRQEETSFRIQVFSAGSYEKALEVRDRVQKWWVSVREEAPRNLFRRHPPLLIQQSDSYYRVRIGGFADREEAEAALPFVQQEYEEAYVARRSIIAR